jgi:hypothetical protein
MADIKRLWGRMTKKDRVLAIAGLSFCVLVSISVIAGFVSAIGASPKQEKAAQIVKPEKTYADVQETETIPFGSVRQNDASLDKGTDEVTTYGVDGVRTKTFHVTYVDGKETARKEIKNEVTTQPITEVTSVGTRVPEPIVSCDPNYSGACVPIASDVDCGGGSGDGPEYVYSTVTVVGSDIYGLDRDGDGYGCE